MVDPQPLAWHSSYLRKREAGASSTVHNVSPSRPTKERKDKFYRHSSAATPYLKSARFFVSCLDGMDSGCRFATGTHH